MQCFVDEGYQLFLVLNQSGVASGTLSKEDAEAAFARTIELLGLPIAEVVYCPHPAFPVGPLPPSRRPALASRSSPATASRVRT